MKKGETMSQEQRKKISQSLMGHPVSERTRRQCGSIWKGKCPPTAFKREKAMRKEIRTADKERGIVQITTVDERFYARSTTDKITGLPTYEYVPSVTWIAEHYPKGIGFYRWLANTGWDESQALKEAAGDKGSKVHAAVTHLLLGGAVQMDQPFLNPSTGQLEPLTLEEYECLLAFKGWYAKTRPDVVAQEMTVWNDQHGYAGTTDFMFVKDGVLWLPDLKTSQSMWPSHELQVSAYRHTPEVEAVAKRVGAKEVKLAILQVGYRRNKDGWKFTEVADQFDLFLAAKKIWAKETAGQKPLQRDYPMSIQLTEAKPQAVDAPKNGALAEVAT